MGKIEGRPIRTRKLDDKPKAKEHLTKHPIAFALCTMTIEYLDSIYIGTPFCGWTDNIAYYFGSAGRGRVSVRPRIQNGDCALVKIREDHEDKASKFKEKVFEIYKAEDLEALNYYLREFNCRRFDRPEVDAWNSFKALVDEKTDVIIEYYRKAIEEGSFKRREESLKRTFKSWLEGKGISKISIEENIHRLDDSNQRKSFADVIFESPQKKIKILTELKITKDTRADIEKSLGQLFRYKLYGEGYLCDELWTVSGHQPTSNDKAWVDEIRKVVKLTYRLAWLEEGDTFNVYPDPGSL